jgi:hypothetical protein
MANYYGSARSNYFKVKDEATFLEALTNIPDIEVHGDTERGFCVLVNGGDAGGWPSFGLDEDMNEVEYDIPALVSEHLQDDEVAIFMEAGAEKLRYLVGYAEAINNKGEREAISINGIYEIAEQMTNKPENITAAEY